MLIRFLTLRIIILVSIIIGNVVSTFSQNCTVNANVDQSICANQPLTLNGSNGGLIQVGTVLWTQVSGPSVIIHHQLH